MTTFDEREHAFEAKLAHDEELKFKARARRNKRLGLWAAGKLGKTGAAAEGYASRLVATEIEKDSASQIFKTMCADFDRAGVVIVDHAICRKMDELLVAAVEEIDSRATEVSGIRRQAEWRRRRRIHYQT
jgi:hypothetical protein